MSTLSDSRLPSLLDKHLAEEAAAREAKLVKVDDKEKEEKEKKLKVKKEK